MPMILQVAADIVTICTCDGSLRKEDPNPIEDGQASRLKRPEGNDLQCHIGTLSAALSCRLTGFGKTPIYCLTSLELLSR